MHLSRYVETNYLSISKLILRHLDNVSDWEMGHAGEICTSLPFACAENISLEGMSYPDKARPCEGDGPEVCFSLVDPVQFSSHVHCSAIRGPV